MSLDLCASIRAWIARAASRRELVDFGDWLEAERYSSFVADQQQVFPDSVFPQRHGQRLLDGSDVVGWLRRL